MLHRLQQLLAILSFLFGYSYIAAAAPQSNSGVAQAVGLPQPRNFEPFEWNQTNPSLTFNAYCKGVKENTVSASSFLFYECLPYVLGMVRGEDQYENVDSMHSLLLESPSDREDSMKTVVTIGTVALMRFDVSIGSSVADMEIELQMQWQDLRLKWNPNDFPFRSYPGDLMPDVHIWSPRFVVTSNRVLSLYENSFSFHNTHVTYTGNVSTVAVSQLQYTPCTMNVAAYPEDQAICCVDLALPNEKNVIPNLKGIANRWDVPDSSLWTIQSVDLKPKETTDSLAADNSLRMCITAKRNSASISAELSLPMAVSALVLMCAQFAGKWKMQIYVKLFAILIQTLSFQTLMANSYSFMHATKLPRVYLFYNFTLGVTIFSLILTMIFWALSRRCVVAPPPYKLLLSMKVTSNYVLGKGDDAPKPLNETTSQSSDNRKDWDLIFMTLHAICSIVIILCYLLGLVIIYGQRDY